MPISFVYMSADVYSSAAVCPSGLSLVLLPACSCHADLLKLVTLVQCCCVFDLATVAIELVYMHVCMLGCYNAML